MPCISWARPTERRDSSTWPRRKPRRFSRLIRTTPGPSACSTRSARRVDEREPGLHRRTQSTAALPAMARTTTTCTASYSGCLPRRSRPSPKRASSERVLRQELLDTELRRRQRRPFFPLPDELAVGEQLRRLLGDRERMRLIVARQHQARRPAARHERAVHAVEEPG